MARNYPVNTREQKFWEQTIDKERDARLQWFEELKGKKDGSPKSKTFAVSLVVNKEMEAGVNFILSFPTKSLGFQEVKYALA